MVLSPCVTRALIVPAMVVDILGSKGILAVVGEDVENEKYQSMFDRKCEIETASSF